MISSLALLLRAALGRPPKLVCAASVWHAGVHELKKRAGGRRESGAFLLGEPTRRGAKRVHQFLYYDDVDPTCFRNGFVEFNGHRFGQVWEICRAQRLAVVADIHVHPGHYGQSPSDQQNPMLAQVGHLALILPNYARGAAMPGTIGIYQYLGAQRWCDLSMRGKAAFQVGWWPL